MVNNAFASGRLKKPIPIEDDFPIVLYADDTLIILPAEEEQLQELKVILQEYADFIGLKINYHKSSLMPINLSVDEAHHLADFFQCQLQEMPFTYLGLTMGTTRPSKKYMSPLVDGIEIRLSATSSFLSYGDRLVLVISMLSSLPT